MVITRTLVIPLARPLSLVGIGASVIFLFGTSVFQVMFCVTSSSFGLDLFFCGPGSIPFHRGGIPKTVTGSCTRDRRHGSRIRTKLVEVMKKGDG
jgi:hypothetical protein